MRLAVISDIHGNALALDAVLNDFKQIDQVVCLGDAIQGGAEPAKVVAKLRELACPVVMGNADDWLITGEANDAEQISPERQRQLGAVREWSLTQLSNADQDFIRRFQPTVEIALTESKRLLCFHGSPTSYDDILLAVMPDEEVQRHFEPYAGWWLAGGHTHLQQLRRYGNTFFFNPGSVGFAYSHQQDEQGFRADPWAEYAVLTVEGEAISLEFRKVPFDVARLIDIYRTSGRPYAENAIAQYRG